MSGLAPSVLFFWALNTFTEAMVGWMLFRKGHFRQIPLFTAYIVLELCQAVFLFVLYTRFGFNSYTAYVLAWVSQGVALLAQIFATVELLHRVLSPFAGVWKLARRLLWFMSVAAGFYVFITIYFYHPPKIAISVLVYADRSFQMIFSLSLLALLFLGRHYLISFHPIYRTILVGICFRSCIAILNVTFVQAYFFQLSHHQTEIWNGIKLSCAVIVQVMWAFALRQQPMVAYADAAEFAALPQQSTQGVTQGAEQYGIGEEAATTKRLKAGSSS